MNQNVNLDLIPKFAVFGNLYFSQYDVGRTATINLLNGTEAYTIPVGATVKIQATKPSGLGFNESCTFSGNVVTVVSTETMTDEAGRIPCELQITSGDTILGTANFLFNVERSPHPEGTTDGTAESVVNEITLALENALQELSDAVDPVVAEAVDEAETQMEAKAQEVIASIPSDYTVLSNNVSTLESYFVEGINLFNPNDPDYVENVELKNSGETSEKTGYFASGFVPVRKGQTVCVSYPTGTYGGASSLVTYDASKTRIGYVNGERLVDANGHNYQKYTWNEQTAAVYFRATGVMSGIGYYMYVYANEMPSQYTPYTDDIDLLDTIKVNSENIEDGSVSIEDTDFIKISPKNLVDLESLSVGIIKNSSSDGDLDETVTNWYTTDFIPVESGETYSLYVFGGVYYGANYRGIPYYGLNKNYLGHIVPTSGISSTAKKDTIVIPENCYYIRASYPTSYVNNVKLYYPLMVLKGTTYVDAYLPYDGQTRIVGAGITSEYSAEYNSLFNKIAIWNGDSICAADNDTQGGWPLRIAKANGMYARNFAVSGGTIAENTGAGHSVCATLDSMIQTVPQADYILIEGGTNDADLIGDSGIGTFTVDDFSDSYISNLNKDTFSGALESIFYRLVTQMKGKHIGYIIPQKMGFTEVLVARRRQYFDRAIQICQKWGVPYIDLWNNYYFNWRLSAHWDQNMTSAENEQAGNLYLDSQHLTTKGYEVQSPIIAEWMKGI